METHLGEHRERGEMPDGINRIPRIILSSSGPLIVGVLPLCEEVVLWEQGT